MVRILLVVLCAAGLAAHLFAAAPVDYVRADSGVFRLGNARFVPIGTNAYYLSQFIAYYDTAAILRVFHVAHQYNLQVIRMWGFYDSEDTTDDAVIQYRPGAYNEHALRALDYVVDLARLNGIRLIIPLVNNWDDFGGMNQYVRWYAETHPAMPAASTPIAGQRKIMGARGQSYSIDVANGYVHDDFYRLDTIRAWYKAYIAMLLSRVNTVNGLVYANDPTIMAWELANEPRSSDPSGMLVASWVADISSYIKGVDENHLVATGEEGFDVSGYGYSPISQYNGQSWMFDGTAGSSFANNLSLPTIDFASPHLYPDSWGITPSSGNTWISDHIRLASGFQKPFVLGEFGSVSSKLIVYDSWLSTILRQHGRGAWVWQLVDSTWPNADDFSLWHPRDSSVLLLLPRYESLLEQDTGGQQAVAAYPYLYQNYPNPWNPATTIRFDLAQPTHVVLRVYDVLGREVKKVLDEVRPAGHNSVIVSGAGLSSGVYIYSLITDDPAAGLPYKAWTMRKMMLVK